MAKWIWRFLTEKDALWVRVVRVYKGEIDLDEEGFRTKGNREMRSCWWKRVLGLSWGAKGRWFRENMEIQIGEGDSISFWHNCWAGEMRLKDRYPRLFRLSNYQGGSIRSMGDWVEGEWVWSFNWNRELRDREEDQVLVLKSYLNNFTMMAGKPDGWKWKANPKGEFTVKTAYNVLTKAATPNESQGKKPEFVLIWNAPATHKAETAAWRVLTGRMATCDNLLKRKVTIPIQDTPCALCQTQVEDTNHLFFSCKKFAEIWYDLLLWIEKYSALHTKAINHCLAFSNIGHKKDVKFLAGLWICTVWCMWKERNEVRFNQGKWSREKLVAEIKSRIWSWKQAFNLSTSSTDFRSWFLSRKT